MAVDVGPLATYCSPMPPTAYAWQLGAPSHADGREVDVRFVRSIDRAYWGDPCLVRCRDGWVEVVQGGTRVEHDQIAEWRERPRAVAMPADGW
jgi:hypothetical protein